MTPLQRFLAGALAAVRIEPDGRQGSAGAADSALLAGAFNPLHAGHLGLATATAALLGAAVAFELCVCNVDKPALSTTEVATRMRQFAWRHSIWLTRTPTFLEKAALFPGAVFVVGIDTAERILAPRYYLAADAGLLAALQTLRDHGCRFLVAARQSATGGLARLPDLAIPAGFDDLFAELPAAMFRLDISSTQLRQP